MKTVLAIVGMAGSGKSEVTGYLQEKGFATIRFGEQTDKALKDQGLELNQKNERQYREQIRKESGMAIYAMNAKPEIDTRLAASETVVIDGLYSWEEYVFLKKAYPDLLLVHVYAERRTRYRRLTTRKIRPLSIEECEKRDFLEIENLHKAGPIAIADYILENNTTLENLHAAIDTLLVRLGIHV